MIVFLLLIGFIAALLVMVFTQRSTIAKLRRREQGLCTECGYDLRGITSDRCPECGKPFSR